MHVFVVLDDTVHEVKCRHKTTSKRSEHTVLSVLPYDSSLVDIKCAVACMVKFLDVVCVFQVFCCFTVIVLSCLYAVLPFGIIN